MSQDTLDESDTEKSLRGDQTDNVKIVEMSLVDTEEELYRQDAEGNEDLGAVARTRKPNPKYREDVEAEEICRAKHSLGGYMARVSTLINQFQNSLSLEEAREFVKNLELAWNNYDNAYQSYIAKNLLHEEFERVEKCYSKVNDNYSRCMKAAYERLHPPVHDRLPPPVHHPTRNSSKGCDSEPKLSPLASSGSKTSRSSRSLQLRELKRSAELKKLMAEQALEQANYEIEMEKKKIDIEMQKQKIAREIRFRAQLEEREADLLSQEEAEGATSVESTKDDLDHRSTLHPVRTKQAQTEAWLRNCPQNLPIETLNRDDTEFSPRFKKRSEEYSCPPKKDQHESGLNGNLVTNSDNDNVNKKQLVESKLTDTPQNCQAILLKVTTLQAMHPVKFSGNAADFPIFRKRIRDNLEDGLLSDVQKIEFLPKFVTGEAYEVVERSAGCSYDDIVAILEERYGQPAAVAAACIETLTFGPKLGNRDYKGLRNFAEQLQCATKRLEGDYEREASTTANMKMIVARVPDYMINKWADVSYSIREKGLVPKLKDLAQFVKRQAAIKNDPGYAGATVLPTETRTNRIRPLRGDNRSVIPPFPRKTTSLHTDLKTNNTGSKDLENDAQSGYMPSVWKCLCCSGSHELDSCVVFQKKDLQARWDIVKHNRLCHVCLRFGHHRGKCESPIFCRCGSDKRHHKLLHNPPRRNEANGVNQDHVEEPKPMAPNPRRENPSHDQRFALPRSTVQYATVTEPTTRKTVLLHVIPVKITSTNGKSVTTYGLLDNASRGTMVSLDVAKELGLKGRKEVISVSTLLQQQDEEFEVVEFTLQSASGGGEIITVEEGLVSEKFNIAERCLPEDIDRRSHPHLLDIEIPEVEIKRVSVLIGKDVSDAHEVFEVRKSNKPGSQLQAQRGPLGWVITGTVLNSLNRKELSVNFTTCDRNLHDQVENFWRVEEFGTKRAYKPGIGEEAVPKHRNHNLSREDMRAKDILEETSRVVDGHYETGLLWRRDDVQLPNNRMQAEMRLHTLKRKFRRDPSLEKKYRATMDDYIAKGYARKLTQEEAFKCGPRTWYLPHFTVTNCNKPDKVRIVFDAAAEHKGTSLNKNLLQGPDYTNSLVGVLLRFREEMVAVVGDIESMFHQVKVRPEDQDSLRFLWFSGNLDETPQEYAMTVHIFGAADSPCSANASLLRTAKDNQKDFDPVTIDTLNHNFYVDDVLKSMPTTESAVRLMQQLIELCAKGGFNLTKFMSNDRDVLAAVPHAKRADPSLDLDLDELPVERALGVRWDIGSDTFGFKVVDLEKGNTMRGVLSTICSVFDPLNLAAPVMMPAKQIMQDLWRKKTAWDQPLEGEILERWLQWKNNLPLLASVKISRCYFSKLDHEKATLQLHHFCDASEVGYGTSTYLRITYPDGTVECAFVVGKSRNAPIKTVSIPRLELQGALLAARVDHAVRNELNFEFERVIFWTDSMITLNYIRNENRRFQTYVANRITEIRDLTTPDQWRHCPGKLNPADDVSRGLDMSEFQKNERWLKGPIFLSKPENHWPDIKYEKVAAENLEIKKEVYLTNFELTTTLDNLLTRFSSWITLLRTFAWLLKFLQWIRWETDRKKVESDASDVARCITLEELEKSKREVAKLVQKKAFAHEILNLKAGRQVKASSHIVKLKPVIMDDGVLRVGGRISRAPISPDAMNPIILPKKHHVVTILIRYLHEKNGHCGPEQVLSFLREQFWVVKARAAIKVVIGKCLSCRKRMARTMSQEMAELPRVRLTPYKPPFTFTGVDYFGPFYVKRGRGKVTEKRWGAIFVCMNSRAVHLEVARSLETDDFILLFVRFLNRRGHVKELRSDNGTNFVGADREIKEAIDRIDSKKVGGELMQRGCKWVFHPPGASHMSGVWERLVKTVKRSLKAILGKDLITEEVLQTVFTEAERIANSRPLTRNPSSPDDDEPLTPNHFLNIRPTTNLPPEIVAESDKFSRKRWRQAQILTGHYWKRWLKEYIPSLQERQKWHQTQRNLQVGDLVLVADDNVARNQWPLACVINVFPGPDGLVRSAEVRAKGSTYKRPITKICLLEASDAEEAL